MEIESKADAIKVLADIKSEQKRLAEANRELNDNVIEKMAADLKDAQQKIAEMAAPKVHTVSEKEATLRQARRISRCGRHGQRHHRSR